MKEHEFRNKIYWFTFFFSVLVVWAHSFNAELFLGQGSVAESVEHVENFFGDTLAQIAVPGFFMISSYLFFRNFDISRLRGKWDSRIDSILIPYILWNAIYYAGYLLASRLPGLSQVVGKGVIPWSLQELTRAILHYKYNYVFWYLYQLILLIVLAPVIYMLIRKKVTGFLYLGFVAMAVHSRWQLPQLNMDALFYYSTAAYLALHARTWVETGAGRGRMLTGLAMIATACVCQYLYVSQAAVLAIVLGRFLAPAGLWLIADERKLPEPKSWMTNNFFLYATHFAFVRLINKTGALVLPALPVVAFIMFFMMPVYTVIISHIIGTFMRKSAPNTWKLLNGSR